MTSTDSPAEDPHTAYYDAVSQADESLDDALAAVRAEQDAGRIGVAEAACERVALLERHLQLLERLRAEHLGGTAQDEDQDDDDDPEAAETYHCAVCGATIGHFIGHGDGWHHFRGAGTAADPTVLYDAGHEATPGGMIP
jgi:hypothetical protein